jgi:hypothetical protein
LIVLLFAFSIIGTKGLLDTIKHTLQANSKYSTALVNSRESSFVQKIGRVDEPKSGFHKKNNVQNSWTLALFEVALATGFLL